MKIEIKGINKDILTEQVFLKVWFTPSLVFMCFSMKQNGLLVNYKLQCIRIIKTSMYQYFLSATKITEMKKHIS